MSVGVHSVRQERPAREHSVGVAWPTHSSVQRQEPSRASQKHLLLVASQKHLLLVELGGAPCPRTLLTRLVWHALMRGHVPDTAMLVSEGQALAQAELLCTLRASGRHTSSGHRAV
ncbi:unnamed protein product [Polarella glacialis]|uniref:Uncharacterized protein n=1 Tax=Polarella glacialis TaxID=89957 RepID=A0A813LP02_POLGL|nr:unnamed protein product [Polarella glacialis]CAE8733733.1 unnamed protein product [Polarella glacialis]